MEWTVYSFFIIGGFRVGDVCDAAGVRNETNQFHFLLFAISFQKNIVFSFSNEFFSEGEFSQSEKSMAGRSKFSQLSINTGPKIWQNEW